MRALLINLQEKRKDRLGWRLKGKIADRRDAILRRLDDKEGKSEPTVNRSQNGDGCERNESHSIAMPSFPLLTKVKRFERAVLRGDTKPLPRLRSLYNSARAIAFRPTVRRQSSRSPPPAPLPPPADPQNKITRPQNLLQILCKQVKTHGKRVPLRNVTLFVMRHHPRSLPPASKLRLPSWAWNALRSRGYNERDVLIWVQVLRANNAREAIAIMERNGATWPKFLVNSLLYSPAPRTQGELVKIFSIVQNVLDSLKQNRKILALIRMTALSAERLPQGLPRIANIMVNTEFIGENSALRVYNDVLRFTANAYHVAQHQNYTSINQLRNYIDESMIALLGHMAEKNIHVKVKTLIKVSAAKLAEDANAAISILELAKPKSYVDLVRDMKAHKKDLALAYEVAKIEGQLSSLEREFLKGRLLGRVRSKEMIKRLRTLQNWRVSTQETFSAWLEFLERRRTVGPAPKESWISVLQMCHDEWRFPTAFWEEAFDLMEEDHVLPNTKLLCLVLRGIKEVEKLDRILERATTVHLQRMNDQIWQIYFQRLCINHTPRALEIFLNAHTTDSAAGTINTLNIFYWNILLHGLAIESRRTNDVVWITRAFDLLDEMERLTIFPSQESLSAICKLGECGGDKVEIKGVPAFKAALDKWHEWVVRPEDFAYEFNLPGIARLIPSQVSFRKLIILAGKYREYSEIFDATWAMLRFGVVPDWETLLDIDMYLQASRDTERTMAVREMFREWLGQYPGPREVQLNKRRIARANAKNKVETEQTRLALGDHKANADGTKQIEAPQSIGDILPDIEVRHETVVDQWQRRIRAKPWFEQD